MEGGGGRGGRWMRRDGTGWGGMRRDEAVRCDTVLCDTMRCGTVRYGAARCGAVRCGVVRGGRRSVYSPGNIHAKIVRNTPGALSIWRRAPSRLPRPAPLGQRPLSRSRWTASLATCHPTRTSKIRSPTRPRRMGLLPAQLACPDIRLHFRHRSQSAPGASHTSELPQLVPPDHPGPARPPRPAPFARIVLLPPVWS